LLSSSKYVIPVSSISVASDFGICDSFHIIESLSFGFFSPQDCRLTFTDCPFLGDAIYNPNKWFLNAQFG